MGHPPLSTQAITRKFVELTSRAASSIDYRHHADHEPERLLIALRMPREGEDREGYFCEVLAPAAKSFAERLTNGRTEAPPPIPDGCSGLVATLHSISVRGVSSYDVASGDHSLFLDALS